MMSTVARLVGQSRNVLNEIHPFIERTLSTAIRYYAAARISEARLLGAVRYDAPIEPERLYDVDPERIERTVSWTSISANRKADELPRFRRPKYRLAGRVFGGDWDRVQDRFTRSTIYQSFREHFEEGCPWEETRFYEETLAASQAGEAPWGCRSESDLQRRCERLDGLYERIATEGYKTQNELHERGEPTSSHRMFRTIWAEIAVNVGRNGEFIFQDGRNRLAIARLVGLDSVPVVILVRHKRWQRKRDMVARGEIERSDLPKRFREHPDLVDLF